MTQVFFIEPTGRSKRWLRRYISGSTCKDGRFYCDDSVFLDIVDKDKDGSSGDLWPHDDPRWPKSCSQCGQPFKDTDPWQLFCREIYRAADGREMTLMDAPVGACWNAAWFTDHIHGPDGRCLVVRIPTNHDWMIDSRASNCTMPDDNEHRCWVRHGRPEDGDLHVDKNGHTCNAGGGSIMVPGWHGFLHNGRLVEC